MATDGYWSYRVHHVFKMERGVGTLQTPTSKRSTTENSLYMADSTLGRFQLSVTCVVQCNPVKTRLVCVDINGYISPFDIFTIAGSYCTYISVCLVEFQHGVSK